MFFFKYLANSPNTFKGRKLGVVVTDNINGLQKASQKEMSIIKMIAPKIGGIKTKQGTQLEAQYTIDNGSIFFDAVVFLLPESIDPKLVGCPFIQDAFIRAKFIAYTQPTLPFFKKNRLKY